MKKKRTITINSRKWILKTHKNGYSNFVTYDNHGDGVISIRVRSYGKRRSRAAILDSLMHEIIESILTDDLRRWADKVGDRVLFCFDHDYLNEFTLRLSTALISCGVIDPNKRVL